MAIKKGYKQTEVGVIPQDWDVKLLPQVTRFRGGKAHEQFISETGDYVCVNSKFISSDGKVRKHCFRNFCCARLNDILMVMSDLPNGKALAKAFLADADDRYAVNQRVCSLTTHRDCPQYLFYILNRNPYFLKFDDGVSQTHLLNRVFQKCPIPLPPTLLEQEAIAGALSDADAWIESLEQLIAKKRQIKQGAMQELLTGKRRLPGFSGQWETKRLGDLARLYQPTTISASSFTTFGFPVYGANGIVGFYHSCNHSTWQVTVTCRGSTCGTVNKTVDKCWITGNAMVLNCDHNHELDKSFLFHLLSKQDLTVCITGTGQPQIVRTPLAAVELRLPQKISEQQAIATILSDMDTEIESLESKLSKAREIKQGMMQELLTGRIRLVKSSAVSANPQEMSHDR